MKKLYMITKDVEPTGFVPSARKKKKKVLIYDTHLSMSWFSTISLLRRCRKCSWMFKTPMIRLEIGSVANSVEMFAKHRRQNSRWRILVYNWLCNQLKIAASWLVRKARFVWFLMASSRNVQEMNKVEWNEQSWLKSTCCANLSIIIRWYTAKLFHKTDKWHMLLMWNGNSRLLGFCLEISEDWKMRGHILHERY